MESLVRQATMKNNNELIVLHSQFQTHTVVEKKKEKQFLTNHHMKTKLNEGIKPSVNCCTLMQLCNFILLHSKETTIHCP